MPGLHVVRGEAEGSRRRPGAELPSDPSLVILSFSSSLLAGTDPSSDTLHEWTVALTTLDDNEDESEIGRLGLYRLCDYTGYSRILAVDEMSGDLLHIAETVLDGDAYSAAFEEAILRLQGGCCAVACAPGASERPADGRELTLEEWRVAGVKIAALWETIGFQAFADGVYLRDTACDYSELLHARRADLAQLSAEFRAVRR